MANFDYNASVSVRLDEIMTFENGFAFQSQSYLSDGRYRIVTIKNVKDGYIDLSDCAYIDELPPKLKESCILKIGDILLSLTGNVGRVGVVCDSNLLLNQRVAKVIAREQAYKPYLYYVLRKPQMKSAMESITRGTAQQNLSPIEALKLTIPFNPDLINSVSAILLRYYEYTIMNNMEIARLTALYNVALPKLMTVN